MILADDPNARRLRAITQNDHAHFSAELISLWRHPILVDHPRRSEILFAIREHDNGWREADSAPSCDPEGRPHDFLSLPETRRQELWQRGVRRFLTEHPWSSALILEHARHLHRHREDAVYSEILLEWQEMQAALLEDVGLGEEQMRTDYAWLELGDALSLALSSRWHRRIELHGFVADVEGDLLRLDPFPLAGATTFRIPCRWIPDRPYQGDADLAVELAMARWEEATVRVVAL